MLLVWKKTRIGIIIISARMPNEVGGPVLRNLYG